MGNFFGRIIRYLFLWLLIFVGLCVISVAKHWDVFFETIMSVVSNTAVAIVGPLLVLGIAIYGLVLIIRAPFR